MKLLYITSMLAVSVSLLSCKDKEEAKKEEAKKEEASKPADNLPTMEETKDLDEMFKTPEKKPLKWGDTKREKKE